MSTEDRRSSHGGRGGGGGSGHRGGHHARRGPKRGGRFPPDGSSANANANAPGSSGPGSIDKEGEGRVDENSPMIQAFLVHQKELDSRHDKYERLVKLSRDVTVESKRIIFLLHRIKGDENKTEILEESDKRLKNVEKTMLRNIAEELVNEDIYQFIRAYTNGLQEFVEALTFFHYEKYKKLISVTEVLLSLEDSILGRGNNEEPSAPLATGLLIQVRQLVPPTEYVLGVADLTGELMRKCIMAIGAGHIDTPFEIAGFLRCIHDGFVGIGNQGPREVSRKLYTLRQSLAKVEAACYTLQVRGSEVPKHMLVDAIAMATDRKYGDEESQLADD